MSREDVTVGVIRLAMLAVLVMLVCAVVRTPEESDAVDRYADGAEDQEAYVLVRDDVVTAQWNYQQLPMHACRWCGRRVNLNRHHVIPQAANPALRDVRENLVVLCRDCHFVLGHRCNWKQYNPDVLYIATHFNRCIQSIDTRNGLTEEPAPPQMDGPPPGITNNMPEKLQNALERILKWNSQSR